MRGRRGVAAVLGATLLGGLLWIVLDSWSGGLPESAGEAGAGGAVPAAAAGETEQTTEVPRAVEEDTAPRRQEQPPADRSEPEDGIVLLARDAVTAAPVEDFGLRSPIAPDHNLMRPEGPLRHDGHHPEGRLVLPEAWLAARTMQIEAEGYAPGRLFTLADAEERDGRRVLEVSLHPNARLLVQVVRQIGGLPVPGTRVELCRPLPPGAPVTLQTQARPPDVLIAMPQELPNPLYGKALLLGQGATGDDGLVELAAPPGEPLALRVLGPGHRPLVREGVVVEPLPDPPPLVIQVETGAAIRGRLLPVSAMTWISPEVPERIRSMNHPGLKLWQEALNEAVPPSMFDVAPLADDGGFFIDGLKPGDWRMWLHFPVRMQAYPGFPNAGWARVSRELPPVEGLQENEVRVVDIDVSRWAPARFQATVTWNGGPPGKGMLVLAPSDSTAGGGTTPNLIADDAGRISATLAAGSYRVTWFRHSDHVQVPLPDLVVPPGDAVSADYAIDTVPARFRVLAADGVTPAAGLLVIRLEQGSHWWSLYEPTDATGTLSLAALPVGDTLRLAWHPPLPEGAERHPQGHALNRDGKALLFGPPVDLGTVEVPRDPSDPRVLRLPR